MSIASRINEMTEHLRNDWDGIDKLGLDITEENSNDNLDKNIENIAPVLGKFYNQVSDKTDLAKNGVVGRTSQETTTGKNLFNKLDYTQITTNGNGSPTNIVKQNDYISFTSNGSTNFSGLYIPNNSVTNYIDNFNASTNYYISFDVTVDKACKFGGGQTTTYIDIPIGKTRVSFYGTITGTINFYVRNAITDGVNVKIENIMVSTESDTTYEPYTYGASPNPDYPQPINNLSGDVEYKVRGQGISEIFPLSLGDIELCNISDYKDRIYSQNGEFYLEKKTGKVVLDGSEIWYKSNTYQGSFYLPNNSPKYNDLVIPYSDLYCNYFTRANISSSSQISSNYTQGTCFIEKSNGVLDFWYVNGAADVSDWKTWLGTHNVITYFPLATSTTTEITQENYPTLYSQLLAIQEFLTKYKINKEFLLDYSSPEIEY